MLLIVESAPANRRGFYSSFAQAGVPVGVLLANSAFLLAGAGGSNDAFLAWLWRIPFIGSLVLVGLAWVVQSNVDETAAFCALRLPEASDSAIGSGDQSDSDGEVRSRERQPPAQRPPAQRRSPVLEALRLHPKNILLAAGAFVGTNTVFYILITFVVAFGSDAAGLNVRAAGGVRYSGASLGYQIGAVFGGTLAPIIATTILAEYHSCVGISVYVAFACVVSLVSVALLKETRWVELHERASVSA